MKNGGVHFSLPEVSTSRESRPKLTYPQVVTVLPLYSVGVAKVQTFKNLAPDTKFESLKA